MFEELKHIELDRCAIYYSPNDCQMNNKSHDFYLHELLILSVGCFDILEVRSKVTVKTSVCWAATFSVDGTYILKMEFIVS